MEAPRRRRMPVRVNIHEHSICGRHVAKYFAGMCMGSTQQLPRVGQAIVFLSQRTKPKLGEVKLVV